MSRNEILQKLADGEITVGEAEKLMNEMKKELTLKITPKGCIGIYGIRRMPISLYYEEFNLIRQAIEDGTFDVFIEENKDALSSSKK